MPRNTGQGVDRIDGVDGSMVEPALEVRELGVSFGGVVALHDVCLDVRTGEIAGLIGPNGAGKTTLFDCIAGARIPQRGQVLLHGDDITHLSAVARAKRGVRRTFQRQQVFGWLSVEENVLLATEWRGGGGGMLGDVLCLRGRVRRDRARREQAKAILQRCGLWELRAEPAGTLPIGALRLMELARAIVDAPALLLLDEPTSGLEDAEITQMGRIIGDLRQSETAVVLIEHDVPFVLAHCDRITVLDLGVVIAQGDPEAIRTDSAVLEAYFA